MSFVIAQVETEIEKTKATLHWRHNDPDGVSNHQPHGCLLNRLFRRRSKKTPKLRVTGLCVGNSPGPVNSPHKGHVTREMFPFDDVIMKPSRINDSKSFPLSRTALTCACSLHFNDSSWLNWRKVGQPTAAYINSSTPCTAYMSQWTGSSLVQVRACHLDGTKPLPEAMLAYYQLDSSELTWIGILSFSFTKRKLKMSSVRMAATLSRGRWVDSLRWCIYASETWNGIRSGNGLSPVRRQVSQLMTFHYHLDQREET